MIEEGFYTYLAAQSEITDIVSTRIYPAPLPSGATFPAITYSRDGNNETWTYNDDQTDFVGAIIQIDAWGKDYTAMLTLAKVIRQQLKNYKGLMGTTTVKGCFKQDEIDVFEDSVEAYRRSQSFLIWHIED